MILDASSLIPALSFIIYIVFIVFGLYSRKDKVDGSFLQYMFFMALWSFGSFMMHANTGILTPLLWNKVMLMGLFGGPISFLATMIHLSGTEKRRYRVFLYAGYILYFFMAYLNLSSKVVTAAGLMRMAFTMSWAPELSFRIPWRIFSWASPSSSWPSSSWRAKIASSAKP